MEAELITLTLPGEVLHQIKSIAARRHMSVSRLLAEQLEAIIAQEQGYARVRVRHLALLEQAPNLGTGGEQRVTREDLHER